MNKEMLEEYRVFLIFYTLYKSSNEEGNVYFLLRQSFFFFLSSLK
jgi:hypothetical protein